MIVMMRKETVDLNVWSWLCSIQVDSSSDVNLWLVVNSLENRLINMMLGGIKCPFHSFDYTVNFTFTLSLLNLY